MTKEPSTIDPAFLDALRDTGLDDLAIREAANIGFHFNFINRVSDAFNFPIPTPQQKLRLAKSLNMAGKFMKGSFADPVETRDEHGVVRPTEVHIGRLRMLTVPGESDPSLRRAVERFVMKAWDAGAQDRTPSGLDTDSRTDSVPSAMVPYLKKLALYAYRITDEDVDALRAAGFSKDIIYEVTMVGAMAAGLVGMEPVFKAMYR